MVFLDFEGFDLGDFQAEGATCNDASLVQELISTAVARDYSRFEVQFTLTEPVHGRFAHVYIHGADDDLFGISPDMTRWNVDSEIDVLVFPESFADYSQWQGSNGTCTRIANAISDTLSHELGHGMWLYHENAFNDCPQTVIEGTDPDVNRHVMATGVTGLNMTQRANTDRYFDATCESTILSEEVKARNYFQQLPNVRGPGGRSDLVKADFQGKLDVRWKLHKALTSSFDTPVGIGTYGTALSLYLSGDVNGDGFDDLLEGAPQSNGEMLWLVYHATTTGDWAYQTAFEFGHIGDRFRVGDVAGDEHEDLVRGEFDDASQAIDWYVRPNTTSGWSSTDALWRSDIGVLRASWFVVDVNGDGKDDLVRAQANGSWGTRFQPACDSTNEWFARCLDSSGSASPVDVIRTLAMAAVSRRTTAWALVLVPGRRCTCSPTLTGTPGLTS